MQLIVEFKRNIYLKVKRLNPYFKNSKFSKKFDGEEFLIYLNHV